MTDDVFLEETEVITRMYHVFHQFRLFEIKNFDWKKSFKDHGLDSLEQTMLLTSIEHEFHTVFEDRVFENFKNFDEVRDWIVKDHNCF